ncbi:heparinase II/III domain-containing protein [Bosea sp. NPDC055594]
MTIQHLKHHPRLSRYLADLAFQSAAVVPEEMVGQESFEGTDLRKSFFAFYGEGHALPAGTSWDDNPGSWHWGHDLNRFGFLCLASAPEQQRASIDLILDWIECYPASREQTPYTYGNLLNVCLRLENWWRFMILCGASGILSSREIALIKNSVFQQTLLAFRLLDKRGLWSNWSFIALRALFFILYTDSSFPFRRLLLAMAWRRLETSIEIQILPDGAQHELSPHYHWVVLEIIDSIAQLADHAGDARGKSLPALIERMKAFMRAFILPDGSLASFGDSDSIDGPRVSRFLASSGGSLPSGSTVYPYAGIGVLLDVERGHHCIFDCGPYGRAHQHEDALSFWLTAYGRNLIIDPGRYQYDPDAGSFYYFLRSSAAHSTVTVGAGGQRAKSLHRKSWRRGRPGPPDVGNDLGKLVLKGRYDSGYEGIEVPIVHERTILWEPGSDEWTVVDLVEGEGRFPVSCRFQCYPGTTSLEGDLFRLCVEDVELQLEIDEIWTQRQVFNGEHAPRSGWFSPQLNQLVPAPCLVLSTEVTLPIRAVSRLRVWQLR